jgi:putative membrane protein insertion efficiency factor
VTVSASGVHEDESKITASVTRLARAVVLAPIVLYRRVLSPALPQRCKYEPTCSRYAVDAIGEYGILRGLVLGVWRLLRCNPWSYGGYDPVSAQRVFKDTESS